jgi:hypothetical protein
VFSRRASWDLTPSDFALRCEARRARGDLVDLTLSNPPAAGLRRASDALAALLPALADHPRVRSYVPDPRGDPDARAAIAALHARSGAQIAADDVVLCAGTSEGYAQLFRLLGDPGDAVHVPTPGYPLFEHLAELEGLEARRYALLAPAARGRTRWRIDLAQLEATLDAASRAVLVIHPHNPTGSTLDPGDLAGLRALAARHGLALISDEVFLDPALPDAPASALRGAGAHGLHFALSGASKLLALPQLKVAWIAVAGPEDLRRDALARLEFASDAYLSVSPLASACLPELLAQRDALTEALRARCAQHRARLAEVFGGGSSVAALPAEAGWAAILRLAPRAHAAALDEEALALALLEDAGVLVQPGFWFELAAPAAEPDAIHLVLSLLPARDDFERGIERLRSGIERALARG